MSRISRACTASVGNFVACTIGRRTSRNDLLGRGFHLGGISNPRPGRAARDESVGPDRRGRAPAPEPRWRAWYLVGFDPEPREHIDRQELTANVVDQMLGGRE